MISYEWTGAPDPDNIVSPSVMLSFGAHVFALTVTDEKGLTSSVDEVVITVFAPSPAKEYHAPEIVLETTGYAVREGAILEIPVSASDPDGETLSLTAETEIKNARFNTRSGVHSSGMFIFQPDYDQQGAYVVVFTATDPFGVRSSKTVTLRVDQVNRPPELSIPAEVTVEEGKILTRSHHRHGSGPGHPFLYGGRPSSKRPIPGINRYPDLHAGPRTGRNVSPGFQGFRWQGNRYKDPGHQRDGCPGKPVRDIGER